MDHNELRVLIVEDDIRSANEIAAILGGVANYTYDSKELKIDISNHVFWVIDQLTENPNQWHIIISDIFMFDPTGSSGKRRILDKNDDREKDTEISDEKINKLNVRKIMIRRGLGGIKKNVPPHPSPDEKYGGLFILEKYLAILKSRSIDPIRSFILISGNLTGIVLDKLIELTKEHDGWFNYFIKSSVDGLDPGVYQSKIESNYPKFRKNIQNLLIDYLENPHKRTECLKKCTVNLCRDSEMIRMIETFCKGRTKINEPLCLLLTGEPGVGKSTCARLIHDLTACYKNDKVDLPYGKLNPTGQGSALWMNLLFGQMKGAYTGADRAREGLLELCDTGTIFIDEVADLPADVQTALLSVIQERVFRRQGSIEEISFHGNFIFATNKNLVDAVENGTFRQDLYDRISSDRLYIEPLRERVSDIIPFVENTFQDLKKKPPKNHEKAFRLTESAKEWLIDQPWRKNYRDLKDFVRNFFLDEDIYDIEATDFDLYWKNIYVKKDPERREENEVRNDDFPTFCGLKWNQVSQFKKSRGDNRKLYDTYLILAHSSKPARNPGTTFGCPSLRAFSQAIFDIKKRIIDPPFRKNPQTPEEYLANIQEYFSSLITCLSSGSSDEIEKSTEVLRAFFTETLLTANEKKSLPFLFTDAKQLEIQ